MGDIPRSTLNDWKNQLKKPHKKGNQGRKTPFIIMEEELFDWFLTLRARKFSVSNSKLQKKALKIKANILEDDNVEENIKKIYKGFTASDGWISNFKNRYNLSRRQVTTKCDKTVEEIKESLTVYFRELQLHIVNKNPLHIYNMDEIGLFFEMQNNFTLEVKGKKHIGQWSSGKDKERVTIMVTACSDGILLPPLFVFKTTEPRNKTFKDDPQNSSPNLPYETKMLIKNSNCKAIHNYSGWVNKRVMENHFLPFYQSLVSPKSLLIFDNCSAHVNDDIINEMEKKKINYFPLAPNTTSITQPVDFSIGRSLKAKIRQQFDDWLETNFDEIVEYNETKNKYKFKSPTKALIIEWTLNAYKEMDSNLVKDGNIFSFFILFIFLAFKFTGITDDRQRKSIIDEKVMDLFVSYDTDEYIHLEKRRLCELQKEIKK